MATTAAEMVAEANAQIETVSPKDAFDEMASGQAVLLDVREPVEWEHHIKGSRHTPELDPPRRVIVYCRSGTRAALAALTLKTLGYQDVANLDGGFNAWKEAGLPTGEHHSDL